MVFVWQGVKYRLTLSVGRNPIDFMGTQHCLILLNNVDTPHARTPRAVAPAVVDMVADALSLLGIHYIERLSPPSAWDARSARSGIARRPLASASDCAQTAMVRRFNLSVTCGCYRRSPVAEIADNAI
jgi:hypothetical protein